MPARKSASGKAEYHSGENEWLLKSFAGITAILNDPHLGFRARLDAILRILLNHIGLEQGSIMTVEKGPRLVVQAATRSELIGHSQPLAEDSVAAWAARNKSPLFIPDIASDHRFGGTSDSRRDHVFLSRIEKS